MSANFGGEIILLPSSMWISKREFAFAIDPTSLFFCWLCLLSFMIERGGSTLSLSLSPPLSLSLSLSFSLPLSLSLCRRSYSCRRTVHSSISFFFCTAGNNMDLDKNIFFPFPSLFLSPLSLRFSMQDLASSQAF